MAEDGTSANFSMDLKLLVNQKTGRVVYAEAGKDFVDLLFAFLVLPTGAIIRILREHGTASFQKNVGSISNVYNSLHKLNATYMTADKSILLKPHLDSSAAVNGFPLLQYFTTPRDFYVCPNATHGYGKHQISTQAGQKCTCGQEIKTQVVLDNNLSKPSSSANSGSPAGYVKGAVTFMITDDLNIFPISTITSITLLSRLYVKDPSELKEMTVTVGPDQVLELLGASMVSKNALNDVFFRPKPAPGSQME
eukprot:PITA_23528